MNRQQISLLACTALMLGGLATYAAHHVRLGEAVPAGREVDVVVASRDLQTGTRVSDKDITLEKFRETDAPTGCFYDTSMILGRSILLPISKGETLLARDLGSYGDPIPIPGMRAVGLEMRREVDLPEVVQRGAQVDILVWNSLDRSMERATTALKNVPVLAVTRNLGPGSSGSGRIRGVVTLLLSPDDALKVAIARSKVRIQISGPAANAP